MRKPGAEEVARARLCVAEEHEPSVGHAAKRAVQNQRRRVVERARKRGVMLAEKRYAARVGPTWSHPQLEREARDPARKLGAHIVRQACERAELAALEDLACRTDRQLGARFGDARR